MSDSKSPEDNLHAPTQASNWRESFYFNWHDSAGRAGLTTIAVWPNQHMVDRITVLWLEDGEILASVQQDPLAGSDANALAGSTTISFHCREPLHHWQLQAETEMVHLPPGQELFPALAAIRGGTIPGRYSHVTMDLSFQGRMPAFGFLPEWWAFLGQGQQHFEQAGAVTGRLCVDGEEKPFAGWGGRDRSWGERDWLRPEWWCWINLQLEPDLFVGAILSRAEGREVHGGYVYQDGMLQPVQQVELQAHRDEHDLHLLSGHARVITGVGRPIEIDLEPEGFLHTTIGQGDGYRGHCAETVVKCRGEGRMGRGIVEYERKEKSPWHDGC